VALTELFVGLGRLVADGLLDPVEGTEWHLLQEGGGLGDVEAGVEVRAERRAGAHRSA